MVFELKTLASINILVQTLLILLLNYATFLAKKRDLRRHCNFIRIAAGIQIAAIVAIMWEALLGYLGNDRQDKLFNRELLIHHSLGILLILVWIYINLAYAKKIRSSSTTLKNMMRSAYIIWTFAFILGLHIYSKIYL
jgi:putative membrane protein